MKKTFLLLTCAFACSLPAAQAEEETFYSQVHTTLNSAITSAPPISDVSEIPAGTQLYLARPEASFGSDLTTSSGPQPYEPNGYARANDTQVSMNLSPTVTFGGDEEHSGLYFSPRFTEYQTNDAGVESYSAEIRLGNVVEFERGTQPKGWYVFAAADGEALSLNTRSFNDGANGPMSLSLDDQITVGDLQTGVSTYFGGTQFTVSYIETEASFSSPGGLSTSQRERFAGFSLAREF
ncbi:hypothetical protein [Ponticaulis sp.]|uniref:hypothetical protein n=1 Tax=Ponticaulis sp. TaxID=2020902 RepID=UPI000B627A44|nr:hypothetical protein [Ponticaulis sp.]MAI89713.1 hypothetical protein [Ponticaulis sp.]OUY00730.1 MAG: hypothetical protein CBB65_04680 [Hyphomonadaceae bacterium TMED5]|tara:strand:- start:73062 stop:73772 length:711 start_codon:yes stop_codon:yes gene_type:complete